MARPEMTDDEFTRIQRDAIRILFLIDAGASALTDADAVHAPADAAGILRSETRLQKLDFWMRNPDYLADELLDEYQAGLRPNGLDIVRGILESEEPDLRRYPMIRFKFGAFEPLTEPLSLLRSFGFVEIWRAGDALKGVRETTYFLLKAGRQAAADMAARFSVLQWYRERAALVVSVAGDMTATELKERQYKRQEYASTELRAVIPPITARVKTRFESLRKGAAA